LYLCFYIVLSSMIYLVFNFLKEIIRFKNKLHQFLAVFLSFGSS
jgi:hypothetical protein